MNSKIIINEKRSNHIENVHYATVVVWQDDKIIYSKGNEDLIVTWRSTAKPFMLFPLFPDGILKYNLTDDEIAVMSSSHNAEKIHRHTIKSIMDKCQITQSNLICRAGLPYFEESFIDYFNEPNLDNKKLFHNCSGKHTAMMLMCRLNNIPIENYWHISHPVQIMILNKFKQFVELKENEYFDTGVDGCGVPTYFTSIKKLADSYKLLGIKDEAEIIRNAILNKSYMIAGKNRIDSALTEVCGFIAKSGFDGVFCVSIPSKKIGIALKIEGGSDAASKATIVKVLEYLNLITNSQLAILENFINAQMEFVL